MLIYSFMIFYCPTGPTNVTVSGITANSALVLWDRPLDDSADIAQYRVYVNEPGSSITVSVGGTRSYLQLNNLQPSLVYSLTVEVVNSLGGTAKGLAKEFKTKSGNNSLKSIFQICG